MNTISLKSLVRHFAVPPLLLIFASAGFVATSHAQSVNMQRLNQNYNVEPARGSRLKKAEDRRCVSCEEEEARNKIKYLKRVLAEDNSSSYQKTIESMIFTDAKFVKRCWKNAVKKDMEFFFTVGELGKANDFAWFPKHSAGKCIKRHIASLEFPVVEKPHHSWLVVSELAR